ncbi:hypothetical protein [Nocardia abscessus]|uniref:hypothetical protein n=1 Tax=Nocardia abscessus TaxID=120957 RepID=UPI00245660BB|nr:hypothetical protein [Nocardia abscessus]
MDLSVLIPIADRCGAATIAVVLLLSIPTVLAVSILAAVGVALCAGHQRGKRAVAVLDSLLAASVSLLGGRHGRGGRS